MKYGHLIFTKFIKFVATRGHILTVKCTKFSFVWSSARGAYSAPPDPLANFSGPTSKREEGNGGQKREEEGRSKGGDPYGLVLTPCNEILKNTLLACTGYHKTT